MPLKRNRRARLTRRAKEVPGISFKPARTARSARQRPHEGTRLFVSGARVSGPLGTPTKDGSYVETVEQARDYVRSLKAAGVDHIKVDLTITDDQLRAVLEEAARLNLRVLGHTQNIRKAVSMGMKPMEHMDTMARALLEQEGKNPRPEGTTAEAAVDRKLFPPMIDYVVVNGDPLAGIAATRNIHLVIKGGEVMDTAYDPGWVNPVPRRVGAASARESIARVFDLSTRREGLSRAVARARLR
jgi:hypothetical protein